MFDDEHRKDLLEVLEAIVSNARECLENHRVLPASITINRERVGMTLEMRKIHEAQD